MRVKFVAIGLATAVLTLALDATVALAQRRVTTIEALRAELAPGDVVSLVQTDGESAVGRLLRINDSDLDVQIAARRIRLTIPFNAIESLERRPDSPRNGTLIGAALGAGLIGGLFVRAAATDWNEIDEWAPLYLGYGALFAGAGALLGWTIDSRHSKPHIRFEAVSQTTRIRSMPNRLRGGIALMVSF